MQKSVIGAPPLVSASASQALTRINAAITNLQTLINSGKFDAASTAKLQTKLAQARAMQTSLLMPHAKSVINGEYIGEHVKGHWRRTGWGGDYNTMFKVKPYDRADRMSGYLGDDGSDDDSDDDDDDSDDTESTTTTTTTTYDPGTLAEIEGAVSTAAQAYATATKAAPPLTIVKGSQTIMPANNSTNTTFSLFGLPAPVLGIGAVVGVGLLIWAFND